MTNPNDSHIPEEILRSEQKPAAPPTPQRPGTFGLPALPAELLSLVEKYGPYLVLAMAILSGFNAAGALLTLGSDNQPASGSLLLGTLLGLGVGVFGLLAYIWLTQRRRLGWNMLAIVLITQLLGQVVLSGVTSILYVGVEIIITIYLMLQIRHLYTK